MTYAVEQLAARSYDILLNGALVASLVREADLLDETPQAERPAPLTAQHHAFGSRRASLEWLGIRDADEGAETRFEKRAAR